MVRQDEADDIESLAESVDVDLDDVEVEEPPERVDVSGYKTAHGAAKATYEALQEWAEYLGGDADEVVLYDPEESRAKRDMHGDVDCYTVAWEAGPSEWATALTGGTSLTGFAGARMNYDGDPEVEGLLDGDGFGVECYYSFDLQFFNL